MCGISLVIEEITKRNASLDTFFQELEEDIKQKLLLRGPDHFQAIEKTISSENGQLFRVVFNSAVLHLRGEKVYEQPAIDKNENILCWNGEIFGGTPEMIPENQNDTKYLLSLLHEVSCKNDAEKEIVNIFQQIEGPFSFLWYHASQNRIYFGHDRFGRRSLLSHHHIDNDNGGEDTGNTSDGIFAPFASVNNEVVHQSVPFKFDSDVFCLSSVAVGSKTTFEEVPCTGIYCIDLGSQALDFFPYLPLQAPTKVSTSARVDRYGCLHSLNSCDEICQDDRVKEAADLLLQHLSNAVGSRVRTIPKCSSSDTSSSSSLTRVGVLFSGGLDSVMLGALTHFHLPPEESVDLLNVCFDADKNFKSPDRLAAEISWKELQNLFPTRQWRFIRINVHFEEVLQYKKDIYDLMQPCDTHMDFNIGTAFWFLSRGKGIITPSNSSSGNLDINDLNAFLKAPQKRLEEEKLAILKLFDGLKDTTTTNDPKDKLCPVINCKRKKKGTCLFRSCRVCCFRMQKYVKKLLDEQTDEREKESCKKNIQEMGLEESVDDLMVIFHLPEATCDCKTHRTKESKEAASALNNSNTQSNSTTSSPEEQTFTEYVTGARVLLVGIGADEQLAGYGRHRTAYLRGGKKALEEELAMDMRRIWKRNLGRDDRCISAHGREARFPFLDENVVKYLKSLPVETICDLDQERGEGDKLILRVAARRLGLYNCTLLAKRAIQFGTRIAKHSNVLSFGSNRQASGDAKFNLSTEEDFD